MKRTIYNEDHEAFRKVVRDFLVRDVQPKFTEWAEAGKVDKAVFRKAGEIGIPGLQIPEEYGGAGLKSFKFNAVVAEELARSGASLGGLALQTNVVLPYFLEYATDAQRARWLPGMAAGSIVGSIAMTEPGTGSDLAGMATTARRDGDTYVLNGAKTFITGGINCDLVVVVARTAKGEDRRDGLTLLVVEDGTPGFERGRNLEKMGLKAQDTAELSFEDVRVPVENVLGEEGKAFGYLGFNLPQERLSTALNAQACAETALTLTVEYVKERRAFGTTISSFQNTKFELASCAIEIEAGRTMVDRALEELDDGALTPADAAKVKVFTTELLSRVVDRCLQLHGGYGFMSEYQISRMYADARVTRIFAGTTEVCKSIISKSLGL
ncbi:acyl-CoA dehydrogenase family protein [Prescottella equi]|uniref:Acyl-[acyl-carrier-protein] dehydrogenase MbtN n=1 Tax=Rhodococcus hoagii TaxID=43767 RepID=A0AAE5MID9_RHOHA|nr:acyl-CoA dehydrogenase family protein [Prescottella equi]ERN43544.1 acyl-CoA dehydrogenase [Prescottella equi NBRC 101255 = C 7]MBM4627791.1 acyl-CoA dehydrogenase [Prescottella equi]MBM4638665.1 acyl-CoA dehydrogenase [Prescottella equi]MBM4669423.1 acyl-CoA dehydrogenase [Prescottella equi]NKV88408.1 acyl-CoA dehydrogenase [Prescottella equi]